MGQSAHWYQLMRLCDHGVRQLGPRCMVPERIIYVLGELLPVSLESPVEPQREHLRVSFPRRGTEHFIKVPSANEPMRGQRPVLVAVEVTRKTKSRHNSPVRGHDVCASCS